MASLAASILQSREIFAQLVKSHGGFDFLTFSDRRAPGIPNPIGDPGSVAYVRFQSISQQDQNFLDEILQSQNADDQEQGKRTHTQVRTADQTGIVGSGGEAVLKGELVINSAGGKRSEAIARKEAVKRAQLVTHNEILKRAHQSPPRQQ
jgi:hypothetical protein